MRRRSVFAQQRDGAIERGEDGVGGEVQQRTGIDKIGDADGEKTAAARGAKTVTGVLEHGAG